MEEQELDEKGQENSCPNFYLPENFFLNQEKTPFVL